MSPHRVTLIVGLLLATGSCASGDRALPKAAPSRVDIAAEAIERGRLATSAVCASCHSTGRSGASPMPAATPLREIARRYPLDQLEESFAEGLVTGHPAMPQYAFRASEIDDLIAYLETLKAKP